MPTVTENPKTTVITPRPLSRRSRAAVWLATLGVRALIRTLRFDSVESMVYPGGDGPVIFCVWHNRLGMALACYDTVARKKWRLTGVAAMISASRDGSVLAQVCKSFGVAAIRGSTSRRGPQALLEATTWMEKNYCVAITPDGPRGPVYQAQEGVIHLAQLTGRPIIPTSSSASRKIRLGSWDRFQIPLPFARCIFRFGPPILVPRDATEADRQRILREVQEAMMRLTVD